MFAVIKTGGKQYKVQEGDVLEVEKLEGKKGQKVTFDQVLLVEDKEKTLIGTPLVKNALVEAEVVETFKDAKVIVFKKKRRKQYKKKRGHRQELTQVKIAKILFGPKAPAPKKAEKEVKPPEVKKTAPARAPVKKAPPKPPAMAAAKPKTQAAKKPVKKTTAAKAKK